MKILSISNEDCYATVLLNSDDLTVLCNAMYAAKDNKDNISLKYFYKVYGNLMMVRDLVQYGNVDDFCFERIAECGNKIEEIEKEKASRMISDKK